RLPQHGHDLFGTVSLLHGESFPALRAGWILSYSLDQVSGRGSLPRLYIHRLFLANPAAERRAVDDGNQVAYRRAEAFTQFQESRPFVGLQEDALPGNPFPQHLVLGLQVLNLLLQVVGGRSSDQEQQRLEEAIHDAFLENGLPTTV
ncbi:MAG: hypothetical protein AB7O59_18630, partial [Pirellulales bacterium]